MAVSVVYFKIILNPASFETTLQVTDVRNLKGLGLLMMGRRAYIFANITEDY